MSITHIEQDLLITRKVDQNLDKTIIINTHMSLLFKPQHDLYSFFAQSAICGESLELTVE